MLYQTSQFIHLRKGLHVFVLNVIQALTKASFNQHDKGKSIASPFLLIKRH